MSLLLRVRLDFRSRSLKVQVKHGKASATAPEVQQLLGANPNDATVFSSLPVALQHRLYL